MRHVIGVTELFPLFDRQGRRSVADPCHTTVRAGPYSAVRVGYPNTAMACANCSCLLLDNGAGITCFYIYFMLGPEAEGALPRILFAVASELVHIRRSSRLTNAQIRSPLPSSSKPLLNDRNVGFCCTYAFGDLA
jgi:hypothetical protein